jgi:hypothetical protein
MTRPKTHLARQSASTICLTWISNWFSRFQRCSYWKAKAKQDNPHKGHNTALGFGIRFLRTDGIYGIRQNADDVAGVRFEVRVKF